MLFIIETYCFERMRIHVAPDSRQVAGLHANIVQAILSADDIVAAVAEYESHDFEEPVCSLCYFFACLLIVHLKMDLNDWVRILNRIDEYLEVTTSANPGLWLPEKRPSSPDTGCPDPVDPKIIHSITTVLKFTSTLLKGSYNKEVYNSTEVHV